MEIRKTLNLKPHMRPQMTDREWADFYFHRKTDRK